MLPSQLLSLIVHSSLWMRECLVRVHGTAIVEPLLFLFSALFEEYLSKDVLFLLVGIVVLHIIVMRLIENIVSIMIAVRILVANAPSLTNARVRIYPQRSIWHLHVPILSILSWTLASNQ